MTISLDAPAVPRRAPSSQRDPAARGWTVAGVLGLVAAILAGMLLAHPATADVAGVRPTFMLSAESNPGTAGVDPGAFLATATAWYADGTHGDVYEALFGPWRPDRPIRMVTIAAARSCSIEVDTDLVVAEQAATNRLAVCVWTAPAG